jgi:hypothetical protein
LQNNNLEEILKNNPQLLKEISIGFLSLGSLVGTFLYKKEKENNNEN